MQGKGYCLIFSIHGLLARYVKLRIANAAGMSGTFSPPPRVSDPDMHHSTCVMHVSWCMPGSLTCGFLWSQWWGKRFRHYRRMRNRQFFVSGKRPMAHRITWVEVTCNISIVIWGLVYQNQVSRAGTSIYIAQKYQGQVQVITSHRYCGMWLLVPTLGTYFWHTKSSYDSTPRISDAYITLQWNVN